MSLIEQLQRVAEFTPELVSGLAMSMAMYVVALFLGLGLGILLVVGRQYGGMVVSRVCTAFIEFMRGTPLLAQILAIVAIPAALNIWLESMGMVPFDISWRIIFPDITVHIIH